MMKIFDIVKGGSIATFDHFCDGCLYYTVPSNGKIFMFHVTTDPKEVGIAVFNREEKAIHLMRYIRKCIESNNFIQIG